MKALACVYLKYQKLVCCKLNAWYLLQMSPSTEKRGLLCQAQRKSDMVMMCVVKGKEREEADWVKLLAECGFTVKHMQGTRSPFFILAASPD